MADNYKLFEDKFRGQAEAVAKKMKSYVPYVTMQQKSGERLRALDIGCGRGEWLEFVIYLGYEAEGIDIDDNMLAYAQSKGLNCKKADAVHALQEHADETFDLITCFHVVEHLNSNELNDFIKEAYRVLRKGGLFIAETPNPDNLKVATNQFYLDVTHQKPIPAELLKYLFNMNSFDISTILYLHEDPLPEKIELKDVLYGVSPDYAVVGYKLSENDDTNSEYVSILSRETGIKQSLVLYLFEQRLTRIEQSCEEKINAMNNTNLQVNIFIKKFIKNLLIKKGTRSRNYLQRRLHKLLFLVKKNPILKKAALKILYIFPKLRTVVMSLEQQQNSYIHNITFDEMPIATRDIYEKLVNKINGAKE